MNELSLAQSELKALAEKTLEELAAVPQPIVRICGPLTTGGFGYAENALRLKKAEEILKSKGYTVFRFGDAEESIKDKHYPHGDVMEYFHKPILESGLIQEAFFLAGWEESKGATWERDFIEKTNIAIREFPEAWFMSADGFSPTL